MTQKPPETSLTEKEHDLVRRIAERDGITIDEAATNLAKSALARRVRKRTGRGPAKLYEMKNDK